MGKGKRQNAEPDVGRVYTMGSVSDRLAQRPQNDGTPQISGISERLWLEGPAVQSADHETVASVISFEGQASPIWRTEMISAGQKPQILQIE